MIRTDTFIVTQVPNAQKVYEQVIQLRNLIDHSPFPSYKELGGDEKLVSISHQLYQRLIAPIAEHLPNKLVVVPDGKLAYLPFEALLTELPEHAIRYRTHHYLLRQCQISYATSATLLKQLQEPSVSNGRKQLLAVAPAFIDGEEEELALRSEKLSPLKFNISEASQICEITSGELLSGASASSALFQEKAGDYQLLHLATHAKANDRSGDYSYLVFSGTSGEKTADRLYASDIYNLQLHADMVVLSACETGVGELVRGEGLISLARAFTYAGAKSLVNSLWKVNDNTTSKLMLEFYENLESGQTKSSALQQAKLSYLDQHKDRAAHPFYWAAFVPYGNMAAIDFNGGTSSLWIWAFGILIAFLLLIIWTKQKT